MLSYSKMKKRGLVSSQQSQELNLINKEIEEEEKATRRKIEKEITSDIKHKWESDGELKEKCKTQ